MHHLNMFIQTIKTTSSAQTWLYRIEFHQNVRRQQIRVPRGADDMFSIHIYTKDISICTAVLGLLSELKVSFLVCKDAIYKFTLTIH